MCRNLRVKRKLEEWRQEGNSYMTLIPRDILNATLEYMEADTWKEEFRWTPVWPTEVSSCYDHKSMFLFLADGSLLITNKNCVQIVSLDAQVVKCNFTYTSMTNLYPDPRKGFWWSDTFHSPDVLRLHHYDPQTQTYISSLTIHLQEDWANYDCAFDEEANCYILHQHRDSYDFRVIKYLPDGSVGVQYPSV